MNAETAQEQKKQSPEATQEAAPAETSADNVQKNETKAEADPKANVAKQGSAAVNNLRVLENIEVKLTVEVGNTEIKVEFANYPASTNTRSFTSTTSSSTKFFSTRGRGRQANVKVSSDTLDANWRFGTLRLDVKPDGTR